MRPGCWQDAVALTFPCPKWHLLRKGCFRKKKTCMHSIAGLWNFTAHADKKCLRGKCQAILAQRGMTSRIIDTFKLGYVPGRWDSLVNFFCQKQNPSGPGSKIRPDYHKRKQQQNLGPFQDRIIFPIFNASNQVIGFGGRVMDDALPKYLNSPETPIYNKSRSLYGLHAARRSARAEKKIYIAEGYFDVLALHQHQITNAVATLGTSMTPEHVRILKGIMGRQGQAILVYDSDAAGIKAAKRSIDLFKTEYVDARIMVLPTGHDPDSYLLEFGAARFTELAGQAMGIIPFLMESAIEKHGLSVDGKIKIITDLLGPLAAIEDDVERSLYIKDLAERMGVDEIAIKEKVRKASTAGPLQHPVVGAKPAPVDKNTGAGKSLRLEKQIIVMALQYPEIVPELIKRKIFDFFEDKNLRSIGNMVIVN